MLRFLPDMPTVTEELLVEVSNVRPTLRGYAGFPSAEDYGLPALPSACTGGLFSFLLDGTQVGFAATSSHLYKSGSTSWTQYTDSTTYPSGYSAGTARWSFVQFGNTTLAVAPGVRLQKCAAGDTSFSTVANAPKASCMATASGFVMLAATDDTGTGLTTGYGDQPNRWWCSQIFNPTGTWAPSVSTQATTGLLVETPGRITALVRVGNDIVAFKKTSMYVGRYVGPPVVWQWSLVPGEVGCRSQGAAIPIGNMVLFVGNNNIYSFDGSSVSIIGEGISEWFFSRLNESNAGQIFGIHDQANRAVMWFYPSGSAFTCNEVLIYNYRSGLWGHAALDAEYGISSQSNGVTYDGFADVVTRITGVSNPTYEVDIDTTYSSSYFMPDDSRPSFFDANHKLMTLTGVPGNWSVTTGDIGDPEAFSLLRRVRPRWRTVCPTATLSHRWRNSIGEPITELSSVAMHKYKFDTLFSARWHSWKLACSGSGEVEGFTTEFAGEGLE